MADVNNTDGPPQRTGAVNTPRNSSQASTDMNPTSMQSSSAGVSMSWAGVLSSHPTPGQKTNMGGQQSAVLMAPGVSDPQVSNTSSKPLWQSVRESTVNIRLKRGKKMDGTNLYDWIVELNLNPFEFKPRSAGMVNRNNDYQVTFQTKEQALKVAAAAGDECIISGVTFGTVSLTDCNVHYMRIHWLESWIDNVSIKDALEDALKLHVDERAKVRKVQNATEETPWGRMETNARNAVVTLPLDADVNSTPARISILKDKEYVALVTVKGLEKSCFKCWKRGHVISQCEYPCKRCDWSDQEHGFTTPEKWQHTTAEHEEYDRERRERMAENQQNNQQTILDVNNDEKERQKLEEELAKKEKQVKERKDKEKKEKEAKEKELKEKEEKERKEKEDGNKEPIDMSKKKAEHRYGTNIDNIDSDESMDEDEPGNLVIDSDAADNSFNSSNVTTIPESQHGESSPKRSRIS